MTAPAIQRFIVIDDDPIHTRLCSFYIGQLRPAAEVCCFHRPETAIGFLMTIPHPARGIILVNINMPGLTGWDFLDAFAGLGEALRSSMIVYLVSASIDPGDRQQALDHPAIKDYLLKPVSENMIMRIIADTESALR